MLHAMSELSEWDKLSTDMKVDLLRNRLDSFSGRLDRLFSFLESLDQRLQQCERQRPDKADTLPQ